MYHTDNIEDAAIHCKAGEEVCFILTDRNRFTLFQFCYFQLKHKTLREFHCIVYRKEKDILYYLLRFVAKLNCGKYELRYEGRA
jgi:hypothetical protein